MPLLMLGFALLVVLAAVALMPLAIVLRYRAGTARRPARGWLAALNLVAVGVSTLLFLTIAALTSLWVPRALTYSLAGLGVGALLGVLGVLTSRWESSPGALHYTPNRWIVLALTLAIGSRMLYGVFRAWSSWHTTPDAAAWLAASGAALSLGVGATVLGYYLAYWTGVTRRARRHRLSA
jgi:hypothetical protein